MATQAAIAAQGLGKLFDGRPAVEDVDLAIAPGEVFGFLGPNGAGKTTTMRMLAALIAPSSGEAWIDGLAVGEDDDAIRRRVGLLTESPGLYESLSAEANLRFFGRLYGLSDATLSTALERYLRRFDLWERRADRVGGFSKGMKQKVALIRALLHRPAVVFLDEPTAGLDPESAQVVHEFIREIQSEGRTIFLCTHNLDEAERLCDRVAIFRRRIIRLGSPTELRRSLFARQMEVIVADPTQVAHLATVAGAVPGCIEARADGPGRLIVGLPDPDAQTPALVAALVGAGAAIRRVAEVEHSLESAYLELIQQ